MLLSRMSFVAGVSGLFEHAVKMVAEMIIRGKKRFLVIKKKVRRLMYRKRVLGAGNLIGGGWEGKTRFL